MIEFIGFDSTVACLIDFDCVGLMMFDSVLISGLASVGFGRGLLLRNWQWV